KIIKLREIYNLSQKDLAQLIKTDESMIELLENAEYEGNSFLMLTVIATALKMRVEIQLLAA
ncbi:MAG TPA: hypothetical protein V6C58_01000, partial [Allocoleopsis sp.]